jgi:hypothetical protein
MLSLFLSAEFCGYYLEDYLIDEHFDSKPVFFYTFGALFLVYGLLDMCIFAFRPDQKDIYVD